MHLPYTTVTQALSTSLGVSGQFDHPDFVEAQSKVETVAAKVGLPLGGNCLAEPQARVLQAKGYRLIAGFDILWLRQNASELRDWAQ